MSELSTPPVAMKRTIWQRIRRWSFRGILTMTILGLLIVGGYYWHWQSNASEGQKELNAVVAHLDATEPGWKLEEILTARNAKAAFSEENICDRSLRIVNQFDPDTKKWIPEDLSTKIRIRDRKLNTLMDARIEKELSVHLNSLKPQLDNIEDIQDLTKGGVRLSYDGGNPLEILLPGHEKLRRLGSVLEYSIYYAAQTGKPMQAVKQIHFLMRLAGALDDGPTFAICALVRVAMFKIAIRALEQTFAWNSDFDDQELLDIQRLLLNEATIPLHTQIVQGERASLYRLGELMMSDNFNLNAMIGQGNNSSFTSQIDWFHFRQYLAWNVVEQLRVFNNILAQKEYETPLFPNYIFDGPRRAEKKHLLVALLTPALDKVHIAMMDHRANCLSLAAAIAAERYRIQNRRWPKSSAEWNSCIEMNLFNDPYAQKPLQIVQRNDQLFIYSLGKNKMNDNGKFDRHDHLQNLDVGIQLWNVEQRGLPDPKSPIAPRKKPD